MKILIFFSAFRKKKEKNRLVVLKSKYSDGLIKDYPREQLEKKYGGDIQNLERFW